MTMEKKNTCINNEFSAFLKVCNTHPLLTIKMELKIAPLIIATPWRSPIKKKSDASAQLKNAAIPVRLNKLISSSLITGPYLF